MSKLTLYKKGDNVMITYENEKDKLEHEKFLIEMKEYAIKTIGDAYADNNAKSIVNPRRAYCIRDFRKTKLYKNCLLKKAKEGILWAVCEKLILEYMRSYPSISSIHSNDRNTIERRNRASRKCAKLEHEFESLTSDKLSKYIINTRINDWGNLY